MQSHYQDNLVVPIFDLNANKHFFRTISGAVKGIDIIREADGEKYLSIKNTANITEPLYAPKDFST